MKNKKFLKIFDVLFVFFTFLFIGLGLGLNNKAINSVLGISTIYYKKLHDQLDLLTVLLLTACFLVFAFLIFCLIIPRSRFRLACNSVFGIIWVADLCLNLYFFYVYFTSSEIHGLTTLLNYSILPTVRSLIIIALLSFRLMIDYKALKEDDTQTISDERVGILGYILRAIAIIGFFAVNYYSIILFESLPPLQLAGLQLSLGVSNEFYESFGLWLVIINPIMNFVFGALFATLFIRNSRLKWNCNAVYALVMLGAAIVLYPNVEKMGEDYSGSIVILLLAFVLIAAIITVDVYTLKKLECGKEIVSVPMDDKSKAENF